jgi:shikimate dehydrogenase
MQIKGTTKLLGIIGNPIEHSKSPLMQNSAIEALNLDYVYVPFDVKTEDLETVLKGFEAMNVRGFNVTIPHKENIIPLLSDITYIAQKVGAVNTVYWTKKGWEGTNTDVDGFMAPLKALDVDWSKIVPLILGAGGASRAVIIALDELGCPNVRVVTRDYEKCEDFRDSFIYTPLKYCHIWAHTWDQIADLLPHSNMIINATPLGMYPNVDVSPFTEKDNELITPEFIVYDLIYTPRPTLLLQQAQQRGAISIDGSEMLIQQGAKAFEIWTGKKAPIEVMRQALLKN